MNENLLFLSYLFFLFNYILISHYLIMLRKQNYRKKETNSNYMVNNASLHTQKTFISFSLTR